MGKKKKNKKQSGAKTLLILMMKHLCSHSETIGRQGQPGECQVRQIRCVHEYQLMNDMFQRSDDASEAECR